MKIINRNNRLTNSELLVDESILSTANGYIGVRANFEEGYRNGFDTIRGTYANAYYDEVKITHGENAFGFPQKQQKMPNVIDAQSIDLVIDGEYFSLFTGELIDLSRELNLYGGYTRRIVHWKSEKGHELKITIKRMTSFVRLESFSIDYEIESINFDGSVEIISTLNGDVSNYSDPNDPRVAAGHSRLLSVVDAGLRDQYGYVVVKTNNSNLNLCAHVTHSDTFDYRLVDQEVIASKKVDLKKGGSYRFVKFAVYTDDVRHESIKELGFKIINDIKKQGITVLYEEQEEYLKNFWETSLVEIEGNDELNEGVQYSLYQLLSSAGRDPHSNIAAKGLSGEGYEGHYFWDTEIYMLPFFDLTNPEIAKNLVSYRYTLLDRARNRSLQMGHKRGAKIPWRTISGDECSAYFLAGSAQYHINADVAYSNIQYYLLTKDLDYIKEQGFELLVETGRIWTEIGHFGADGLFRIDAVTGPDEYTTNVNNNYYTNSLAQYHMEWIGKFYAILEEKDPEYMNQLCKRIGLDREEIELFKKASASMYLPYSKELDINLQDDTFINRAVWDFEGTPKDKYPLLLNFHPLTIYRYQVCKQADTVLSHFLLDNVSNSTLRNSYDYYEKITTHDSSLSPAVFSIMANRIGLTEKAYKYFEKTVRLDLDNSHGNTKDGLHIANIGGVFLSIVYGFGGLRVKEDGVHLAPVLPKEWSAYQFRIQIEGKRLQVKISDKIEIVSDGQVDLVINNQPQVINVGINTFERS